MGIHNGSWQNIGFHYFFGFFHFHISFGIMALAGENVNKKAQAGVILFVIIAILIVVGIGLLAWKLMPKGQQQVNTTPPDQRISYGDVFFKLVDEKGDQIIAKYEIVRSDGIVIASGITLGKTVEQLKNLSSNYTYTLLAVSDDKYAGIANFGYNDSNVRLTLRALGIPMMRTQKVQDDKYYLQINPNPLIKSALLCEAHGKNIINVFLLDVNDKQIPFTTIPDRLATKIDRCFPIGTIDNSTADFTIYFTSYPLESGDKISFLLVDSDYSVDDSSLLMRDSFGGVDLGIPDFWQDLELK